MRKKKKKKKTLEEKSYHRAGFTVGESGPNVATSVCRDDVKIGVGVRRRSGSGGCVGMYVYVELWGV